MAIQILYEVVTFQLLFFGHFIHNTPLAYLHSVHISE